MAAWQIPLEGPRPQPNPGPLQSAVMGEESTLNAQQMMQMRQVRAQQIQSQQMELQRQQTAMQAQQFLNQSIQKNMKPQPDGSIQIDHSGVIQDLAQSGWGSQALPYQQGVAATQANVAKALGDQLDNHAKAMEQIGQVANGLYQLQQNGATPDVLNREYQKRLPQFRNLAAQAGQAQSAVPDQYDPNQIGQWVMGAPKVADVLRQTQAGLDYALKFATEQPKTAAELKANFNRDVANTTDQASYDKTINYYRALQTSAANGHLPDLGYGALLSNAAPTWTADVAQQAKFDQMNPEQQEKYTNQVVKDAAQYLGGPAGESQTAYAKAYASIDRAAQPFFDDPGAWSKDTEGRVNKTGQTAEQKVTLAATAAYRNAELMNRQAQLAISGRLADWRTSGNPPGTSGGNAQAARDQNLHDRLQNMEQGWWDAHAELGDLVDPTKTPDRADVSVPRFTSDAAGNVTAHYPQNTQPMTPQLRSQLMAAYKQAQTSAQNLASQQRNIRGRHHWGEFAPGGQQPETPPAPSPALGGTSIPDSVATSLKQAAPGIYTGKDGIRWQRDENGNITKLGPKQP